MKTQYLFVALIAGSLAACGGGGGSSVAPVEVTSQKTTTAPSTTPPVPTFTGAGVAIQIVEAETGGDTTHGDTVRAVALSVAPNANTNVYYDSTVDRQYSSDSRVTVINHSYAISSTSTATNYNYLHSDGSVRVNGNPESPLVSECRFVDSLCVITNVDLNNALADEFANIYQDDTFTLNVLAAGNDRRLCPTENACNIFLLAAQRNPDQENWANAIFVGATTHGTDEIAPYSEVAGTAMNHFIVAEEPSADLVGTSYTAPLVSGTAALLAEKFPTANPAQIKHIIFDTADDLGATGIDPIYGHGKLNTARAVSPVGALR